MLQLLTTFTGDVAAVDATFTGDVAAVDATFTGDVTAVDGNFTGDLSASNYNLRVENTQIITQTENRIYSDIGPYFLDASLYSKFIFTRASGEYYNQVMAIMNGTVGQIVTITMWECNATNSYFRLYNRAIDVSAVNRTLLTNQADASNSYITKEAPCSFSLIYLGSTVGWLQIQ